MNSVIFDDYQIRAARIQISNDTGSKFSLLFPRITAIRNDKSVDECTLTEFQRYRTVCNRCCLFMFCLLTDNHRIC
jgi:hypothetical protein